MADPASCRLLIVPLQHTDTTHHSTIEGNKDRMFRIIPFAVILIATGANDTRSAEGGTPVVPIAEYRQNLEKLILIAKEYTDKILLVGIAPVEHAVQQFKGTVLSNELLQNYDTVMTEVADVQAITKIDVMSQFLTAQSPIFSPDGVHPNDGGHEIIKQAVAVKLDELLKA